MMYTMFSYFHGQIRLDDTNSSATTHCMLQARCIQNPEFMKATFLYTTLSIRSCRPGSKIKTSLPLRVSLRTVLIRQSSLLSLKSRVDS